MHQISVWFVCKLCRSSFQAVPDLIKHKIENHFEQFKSIKHIIFEERFYDGDGDFETFADEDICSTGEQFIDESQVDWNRNRSADRIQNQHLPLNNVIHIQPDHAVFEDQKPLTYFSPNSDLQDSSESRAVSFTIEQDSVIINVATLNDVDSTPNPEPEQTIIQSQHIISKENKQVCNAAARTRNRITNPFVLLRRLPPKEIENAKLSNKNVPKLIENNSDIPTTTAESYPFDSDCDQLSVNSDQAGGTSSSDCEIDVDSDSDVKPCYKLIEATTVIVPVPDQNQFTCPRRKCNQVFQLQSTLATHLKMYHGADSMRRRWLAASGSQPCLSSDEDNSDTPVSVPVPVPGPAVAVAHADWAIKETPTSTIIESDNAQDYSICPYPKCDGKFVKKNYLSEHIKRHERANEVRRRRRMLAASCSPTHGNDEDEDGDDTPKSVDDERIMKEAGIHNSIGNPYDKPPVTLSTTETSAKTIGSGFDKNQQSLKSNLNRTSSARICKIGRGSNSKQLTKSKKSVISKQDYAICPIPKCERKFYKKQGLPEHMTRHERANNIKMRRKMLAASCSPTHGNDEDEDGDDTPKSANAERLVKEAETNNSIRNLHDNDHPPVTLLATESSAKTIGSGSDKNQLSLKSKSSLSRIWGGSKCEIDGGFNSKQLTESEKSVISEQDYAIRPIPKCERKFYKKQGLPVHMTRHERANNIKMRRKMLAASCSPTHGNDEDEDGDDTPKSANAERLVKEAETNNSIRNLHDNDHPPVTLLATESSAKTIGSGSDKNQLSLKSKSSLSRTWGGSKCEIDGGFNSKQLTESEKSVISEQDYAICPIPKCERKFYKKQGLPAHIKRHERANEIKRRRKILLASCSPTHGNNEDEDNGDALKLAV